MDILEMKEEASWRRDEARRDELIEEWNRRFPIGTVVKGQSYKLVNRQGLEDIDFDGPTTSKAYADGTTAVVDIKGHTRVSLHREFKSVKWDGNWRF